MENTASSDPLFRSTRNEPSASSAETDLLEKTYKMMDSIFPGMKIKDLDAFILMAREGFSQLQYTENRDSLEYGKLALRLALLLVTRFVKERRPGDFTEAKELEAIVHRRHISDDDEHEKSVVELFKSLISMATQAQEIQRTTVVSDTSAISSRDEHSGVQSTDYSRASPPIGAPLNTRDENKPVNQFTPPPLVPPPFLPPMTPTNIEMVIRHTINELHTTDASGELGIYASYCFVLAFAYFSRYQQKGDLRDLEESLDYQATAFYLLGNLEALNSPNLLIPQTITIIFTYLSKLGFLDLGYTERPSLPRVDMLELLGDLIPFMSALSPASHLWYLQLGSAYYRHYSASKDPNHAEAAITHFLCALEHIRAGDIIMNVPWFTRESRVKLGILFCERYTRNSDSNDLNAAIESFRIVNNPMGSVHSAYLGMLYQTRYLFHGNGRSDKEQSIFYFRKAIELAPEEAPLDIHLSLSQFLLTCFRREGNMEDLDTAFDLLRIAADREATTAPRVSRVSPQIGLGLAEAHELRYLKTGHSEDRDCAFEWYRKAAQAVRNLSPSSRGDLWNEVPGFMREWGTTATYRFLPEMELWAAMNWGEMALERDLPECVEAFDRVATLLPDAIWMGNKLEDKHSQLKRFSFGPSAVTAMLYFGTVTKGVEYLEQGLSVTYRQLLQLRSDTGELEQEYPEMASRLKDLSDGLRRLSERNEKAFDGFGVPIGTNNYTLGTEYNDLVAKIRTKPGFEDLFLPLPYTKLATASAHGPVVMVSSDRITGTTHALIILGPQKQPIPLPLSKASFKDVRILNEKLLNILGQFRVIQRTAVLDNEIRAGRPSPWEKDTSALEFEGLLKELWIRIVQPIFDELATHNIGSGRVWWCPSGPFAQLPLHAAAPIDCPYTSSYTYTLEALINAREQLSATVTDDFRLAAVGTGLYPGRPSLSLPSVKREMQVLAEISQNKSMVHLTVLEDEEAHVESVLAAIKSSEVVHLACHGFQNLDQPLDSHLMLSAGDLDLRRILAEELKSAQFAFLSACQTARGNKELINESVHLAGGFMAAGFKGVVGTMWSIADEDAPRVAKEVYDAIITGEGLDITKAVDGLQRAVRKMREANIPPHRWAPFIHVGI